MFNFIVYILSIGMVLFLGFFGFKRIKLNNAKKMERMQYMNDLKEKYSHLKSDVFDQCKDEELYTVVVMSCTRKEEEDENFLQNLTKAEKTIYSIYMLNTSIEGGSNMRVFFTSPSYEEYVPLIHQAFLNIGLHEIAELIRCAKRLNEILDNSEEDDEDMGDYSTFNFTDFTHEYISMITGTNFDDKVIKYIREHKQEFVMNEEE